MVFFSATSLRNTECLAYVTFVHTMFSCVFLYLGGEDFLFDAEVSVCGSESLEISCSLCGHVTNNASASWVTVMCPETGLDGSQVAVQKHYGRVLVICEIEVHGETVHS